MPLKNSHVRFTRRLTLKMLAQFSPQLPTCTCSCALTNDQTGFPNNAALPTVVLQVANYVVKYDVVQGSPNSYPFHRLDTISNACAAEKSGTTILSLLTQKPQGCRKDVAKDVRASAMISEIVLSDLLLDSRGKPPQDEHSISSYLRATSGLTRMEKKVRN